MPRRKIEVKSYRGRLTIADIFRIIAVILAVLVLVSAAALVYTRNGGSLPQLGLDGLFAQEETQVEVPPEPEDEPEPQSEPEPQPEPEPEPEPEPDPLVAVELTLEEAREADVLSTLAQMGANGVILDMKADDGTLGFYTDNATITLFPKVIDQTADDTAALASLLESDIHTVARISAFKDNIVGNDVNYAILTNSGYRWVDEENVHWSSPSMAVACQYLIACIVEAAELGFDEILLDNFGYPDRGNLHYIRLWEHYDLDMLDTVMTALLAEISQELEAYPDVTLSVRVPVEVLDGTDTRIGLTVEALNRYAHVLWIDAQDEEVYAQSGITLEEPPVLVGAISDAEISSPQAELAKITF